MAFGKTVADSLETGESTEDLLTDLILINLPKLERRDKEVRTILKYAEKEVPLLIKPDSASFDYRAILEYKTGAIGTPWTQKMADTNGQLTFYDVGVECFTGYPAEELELIWLPTTIPPGKIMPELTGEIKRFPTKRTHLDRLKMKIRMLKAWKRIGEITERELL